LYIQIDDYTDNCLSVKATPGGVPVALKHAALAALLDGEATGYELAKRFDLATANFWSATPQQLYRELARLEEDGLVAGRVVEQTSRPNKRVFAITEAGRGELRAFTAQPTRPTALRDELAVKLQALDEAHVVDAAAAVRERLGYSREKLKRYIRLRERVLAGRSEDEYLASAERIGPYLTLLRGLSFERENVRWMERILDILAARGAGTADPGPTAALSAGGPQDV
jgi:DNA-binding PadR family transcriptional regulator